jgi:pyruvate kinase
MKKRSAKIVATIGPASQDEETIRKLILSGVNITRLNFSHGTHAEHAVVYERIRRLSQNLHCPVTILQDLQGPKIRTGEISGKQVEIHKGQLFTLTTQEVCGDTNQVSVDFPHLIESATPGGKILLDDGNLELEILSVSNDQVRTRVIQGGILKSNKGVNLPGAKIDIPGFTEKDFDDLKFGLGLGVDVIAVSFVQKADDIQSVRDAIETISKKDCNIPIIAKLERPSALKNLTEILSVSDGVMVARGDLGVEMPPEEVPIAQKNIISLANKKGRLVITATQMLDSMMNNPRPTRAEASDVANAILDGSDAVMLSGETAAGKFPLQAVEMMNAIVCQAETHIEEWGNPIELDIPYSSDEDAFFMTRGARELAHDRNVAGIAVFTNSGRTALLMSKTRPSVPIYAFTTNLRTFQRLSLYWGVYPFLANHADSIDDMIRVVETELLRKALIQPQQQVILLLGYPIQQDRPTNLALLHTIGSLP